MATEPQTPVQQTADRPIRLPEGDLRMFRLSGFPPRSVPAQTETFTSRFVAFPSSRGSGLYFVVGFGFIRDRSDLGIERQADLPVPYMQDWKVFLFYSAPVCVRTDRNAQPLQMEVACGELFVDDRPVSRRIAIGHGWDKINIPFSIAPNSG